VLATAGAVALAALLWITVIDGPAGGGSAAVAPIRDSLPAASAADDAPQRVGALGRRPAPELEGAEGGRQPASDSHAAAARPPRAVRATAAPLESLIEPSAYGPIPRIADDGLRPLDAYARPARAGLGNTPRAVIILGGMGLSQTTTQRAIEALPSDVTLAFAPYGSSLQRWSGRARDKGHEILMQLPLEPFGYPEADPGPRTLLASAAPEENEDHLAWLLSRITSYAGVMNYMGARFTAEEAALRPLLAELAARGLYYVDDGSSARSKALLVGEALGAPVLAADLVIDEDRSRVAIDRALTRLEEMAQSRGLAVGVASAFGTTVDALAEWIPEAQSRGIVILPASAALGR
ncbi:MAG TPA: divergent polysaccharide deacetylase family protein, partial [Afifellaceae bacterium]|nr:divergent polysaccharide deacetylase family protein [Afifellaceae bacterium]